VNLGGLDSMIDDVLRAWSSMDDLQREVAAVRGTGTSDDGLYTAVVGPQGHLVVLTIDPRALRRPDSKEVAAQILVATERAIADASRKTADIVNAVLPSDLSLERLGTGVTAAFGVPDAQLPERGSGRDG
jgi:DNA-binding protein YbaB